MFIQLYLKRNKTVATMRIKNLTVPRGAVRPALPVGKGPSVWLHGHATAFNSQSLAWTLHVASKPHKVQWETSEMLPKVVKTSHNRQETARGRLRKAGCGQASLRKAERRVSSGERYMSNSSYEV